MGSPLQAQQHPVEITRLAAATAAFRLIEAPIPPREGCTPCRRCGHGFGCVVSAHCGTDKMGCTNRLAAWGGLRRPNEPPTAAQSGAGATLGARLQP